MRRSEGRLRYPETPRVAQSDDYHGEGVDDPYRWLEDLDSAETRKWIAQQNAVTESFLAVDDGREDIRARITDLWNFEKYDVPVKRAGRYFYSRNSGLQNQSVVYTADSLSASPTLLLDPNLLSEDGTVALTLQKPSPDGKLFAYSVSSGGSDWQEIRVRDVATRSDLEDRLGWVKFSAISWSADSKGFFYSRYDEPGNASAFQGANYFQKLYYHRLGTDQNEDVLVCDNPDEKEWGFAGEVTDDGRYLIVHVWQGSVTRNRVYYRDLAAHSDLTERRIEKLLDDFDARYSFVGNRENEFWFLTDLDAPKGRLIAIDIGRPEREAWREILPESEATLEDAVAVPGGFVVSYLEDAHSRVDVIELDGSSRATLPLPGLGTVAGIQGRPDDPEVFYAYTSFTQPLTIYRYDVEGGETEVFRQPEVDIDSEAFETRQVFYSSADGTRIPMFLVHRRGLRPEGNHPTVLYAYGGFNISVTPAFTVSRIAWLEMGGVYAVANIRGGGEYGERWHQAGIRHNKQDGIDDFIAAAQWLVSNGYTSRERLAINGGSNGGMLVGAAIVQRPDLFAAAVPAVGVMDLLRFHRFTIGWAWTSDYGSPDDPEDFRTLRACSPYHNIRQGAGYPATLVTTGDHDDRVVPSHSFKFAAALQHAQAGEAPVLLRVAVSAGHGAGKPTAVQIDEATDVLTFLRRTLIDQ